MRRYLGYLTGIVLGDGNLYINNGGYRIRIFLNKKEINIVNKVVNIIKNFIKKRTKSL